MLQVGTFRRPGVYTEIQPFQFRRVARERAVIESFG
jgi:hypothetical protein